MDHCYRALKKNETNERKEKPLVFLWLYSYTDEKRGAADYVKTIYSPLATLCSALLTIQLCMSF